MGNIISLVGEHVKIYNRAFLEDPYQATCQILIGVGAAVLTISVLQFLAKHRHRLADAVEWLFECLGSRTRLMTIQQPMNVSRQLSDYQIFKSVDDCNRIIACKGYAGCQGENTLGDVASRAFPNQRLADKFHIDNGFTTFDEQYSREFRKEAQSLLDMVDVSRWNVIAGYLKLLTEKQLLDNHGSEVMQFDGFVQSTTMKMTLYVLFSRPGRDMKPEDHSEWALRDLASNIDLAWRETKPGAVREGPLWDEMEDNLRKIFPNIHGEERFVRKDNPLNLILPAYETMWRAVLFGVIEVAFKNLETSTATGALTQLGHYLKNPNNQTFRYFDQTAAGAVSVAHIVNEVLRRYPPTKTIYRRFHMSNKFLPETVAASIWDCHHDKTIWGPDAEVFRPARWRQVSRAQRSAFMPFGGSRFVCPAQKDFGPRMIGLLIAAIASQFTAQEWGLAYADEYDTPCSPQFEWITETTELNTQRGFYRYLNLQKKR